MINFNISSYLFYGVFISFTLPIIHITLLFLFKEKSENKISQILLSSILINFILFYLCSKFLINELNIFSSYGFYNSLLYLGFVYIGYTQFYSLLRRGFTIRLLIDLSDSKQNITRNELASIYSGGQGLEWFLQKRLSGLQKFNLLNIKNNKIELTNKSQIIFSKILIIVNKVLGIKING